MFIKCPKCSTGYNIPDEKLGEKPQKMRCSRCKTVFAITRRGGNVPAGYEEFTGRQSALPGEFAFLKHAEKESQQPVESEPKEQAPQPTEAPAQPPPPKVEAQPPTVDEDVVQKAIQEVEERAKLAKKQQQAEAASQVESQAVEQAQEPVQIPISPESQPQREPVQQLAQPSPSVVSDIYGGTQSAWEIEAPMELGSYEIDTSSPGQKIGKVMFVVTALVAAFFIFVAYRNGWSLSFANLGEQVAFAFSDKELERIPPEVEGIEAIMEKREIVNRKKKLSLLVVSGNVFNNSTVQRSNVVIRGRIFDSKGELRTQARFPCDKIIEMTQLKKAGKGEIDALYLENGAFYNCSILGESSVPFQIVFEELPPDYNESFRVEVEPVSARTGK